MKNLVSTWVTCDGGPLLLVGEEYLLAWEGSAIPSPGRQVQAKFRWNPDGPATDYDRACDVDDWLGVIDVGQGKGLVLDGGEPFMTTWLPLADGGLLVRWVSADSEEELIAAAQVIPEPAYVYSGLSLHVGDSPLVLLAACESYEDQIYPRLEFRLLPGQYSIVTSEYADENTSLICHRLKRQSA